MLNQDLTNSLNFHIQKYKENTLELNAVSVQVKELQDKLKKLQEKDTELENSIDLTMQALGEKNAFQGGAAISYIKSSRLKVVDEEKLPSKFFKTVEVKKRLDAEIKKAIKDGEQFEGAIIEEHQNIQIKF
jgi:hypothetical protein